LRWIKFSALRPNTNFLNHINAIPPVQTSREKYSAFRLPQINGTTPAILSRQRGVGRRRKRWERSRWTRWCCVQVDVRTNDAIAYGEVVRVRRPGAGVKSAEQSAGDGGKKAGHQDDHV
jgi:hypothetical protein